MRCLLRTFQQYTCWDCEQEGGGAGCAPSKSATVQGVPKKYRSLAITQKIFTLITIGPTMTSQTANFSDCNQSRTQLRVWWLEPGSPTTLRRFSSHFIGCRCDNASLSSWRHWFTSLADDFRLAGRGRPGSRSAASMMLDIPRTTTSLGDKSICRRRTACVWNSLPPAIRDPSLSPSIFGKAAENLFFV